MKKFGIVVGFAMIVNSSLTFAQDDVIDSNTPVDVLLQQYEQVSKLKLCNQELHQRLLGLLLAKVGDDNVLLAKILTQPTACGTMDEIIAIALSMGIDPSRLDGIIGPTGAGPATGTTISRPISSPGNFSAIGGGTGSGSTDAASGT